MKRKQTTIQWIIIACVLLVCSNWMVAQNSKVLSSAFDMGFGVSRHLNTSAKSLVGQVFVGTAQGPDTRMEAGFLSDTLLRGPLVAVKAGGDLSMTFTLFQNYPNPFNPSTMIVYDVPRAVHVILKVYNILGQEVLALVEEIEQPGHKLVEFGARDFASGVYFYRLVAGEYVAVKKMIVLK